MPSGSVRALSKPTTSVPDAPHALGQESRNENSVRLVSATTHLALRACGPHIRLKLPNHFIVPIFVLFNVRLKKVSLAVGHLALEPFPNPADVKPDAKGGLVCVELLGGHRLKHRGIPLPASHPRRRVVIV